MIRVNLGKKAATGGKFKFGGFGGKGASGSTGEVTDFEGDGANRALITRLAIILMGSALLFAYEQSNIPPLKSRLSQMRREVTEIKKKNAENANVVQENLQFESDQAILQGQINAIEQVKKDRLKEVRILDYIQREIPEKVWLQKLELKEGKLIVTGFATADSELTTFMEGLQRSAYLKEISLIRSTESVLQDMGIVKKFEISCLVERSL